MGKRRQNLEVDRYCGDKNNFLKVLNDYILDPEIFLQISANFKSQTPNPLKITRSAERSEDSFYILEISFVKK